MKKKWIWIILIIALGIGGFYMGIPYFKNQNLKQTNLTSCRVSCGGGMLGGYSSQTLKKEGNKVVYVTENKAVHNERLVTKAYLAKEEDLELIKDLVIRYDLYRASKKGQSPIQALDAETCTVSFSFEDGTYFSVSDTQDLSRKEMEHTREITNTLANFAVGEPTVEIEPHEIALILDGYQEGYELEEFNNIDAFLEQLGNKHFYHKEDYAQATKSPISIDVTGINPSTEISKGALGYDANTNELLFFYEDTKQKEPIYVIGHLSDMYDTSIQLIKDMQEKEYDIYMRR